MSKEYKLSCGGNIVATIIVIVLALIFGFAHWTNVEPYNFWSGLWHGFVSPIALIAKALGSDVVIYGCNNSGTWYDFGFLIGCITLTKLYW